MSEAERAGAPEPVTTYNLLFVCSGNTCRSPMAAAVARAALRRRGWTHVAVQSAGLAAFTGTPAAENAVRLGAEKGLDLSGHEAQPLTPELVEWADLILGMSMSHVAGIAEMGGGAKAALITDFEEGAAPGSGIADPFGGSAATYRRTLRQITHAVEGVLLRLEPILAP
jgi:protein-tyrosine-phosphatase